MLQKHLGSIYGVVGNRDRKVHFQGLVFYVIESNYIRPIYIETKFLDTYVMNTGVVKGVS